MLINVGNHAHQYCNSPETQGFDRAAAESGMPRSQAGNIPAARVCRCQQRNQNHCGPQHPQPTELWTNQRC